MPNFEYSGWPSQWFPDEQIIGQTVRLIARQPLGPGLFLNKGECFKVVDIVRKPHSRKFILLSHTAKRVPIEGHVCELLFKFELSPQGKELRRGKGQN